jgi:hypothetical protein
MTLLKFGVWSWESDSAAELRIASTPGGSGLAICTAIVITRVWFGPNEPTGYL